MPVEIRKTTITPVDVDHDAIKLYISDAPQDDESATLVLQILVRHRALLTPTLVHLQKEAMAFALDTLTPLIQSLAKETRVHGDPPFKNPKRS